MSKNCYGLQTQDDSNSSHGLWQGELKSQLSYSPDKNLSSKILILPWGFVLSRSIVMPNIINSHQKRTKLHPLHHLVQTDRVITIGRPPLCGGAIISTLTVINCLSVTIVFQFLIIDNVVIFFSIVKRPFKIQCKVNLYMYHMWKYKQF